MLITSLWFIIFLLIMLFSGMFVGSAMTFVGIIGFEYFMPRSATMIGNVVYNSTASFTLSAIPLFILMGEIIINTGISKSLYRAISKLLNFLPGGLIHSNIFSCAIFAAISGSSVATAAAIGSVAYKEQKERNYPIKLVTGSLAAAGTLGILIPPSITMIIYGSMTGVSVGKLFIAGFIPGISLALMFMGYVYIFSVLNKKLMPETEKVTFKEYVINFFNTWKEIWPIIIIILTIFVGIYGGFMTPTEAAAISVVESLIIALILKKLTLKVVKQSAVKALRTTGMIMFTLVGANVLGNIISMIKLPANLCNKIAELGVTPYYILFYVICLYIILGCLMNATAVIVLTLPITYPLVVGTAGFNEIWFGVLIVLLSEIALITPPVGMNVYVIHGITEEKNIGNVFAGILPFLIIMILFMLLVIIYPQIVLFLPTKMMGY